MRSKLLAAIIVAVMLFSITSVALATSVGPVNFSSTTCTNYYYTSSSISKPSGAGDWYSVSMKVTKLVYTPSVTDNWLFATPVTSSGVATGLGQELSISGSYSGFFLDNPSLSSIKFKIENINPGTNMNSAGSFRGDYY